MPQLIGGLIGAFILIYAAIYLLAAILYALLIAVPASIILFLVAVLLSTVLNRWTDQVSFSVELSGELALVKKVANQSVGQGVNFFSCLVGLVVAGFFLNLFGGYLTRGDGSDPVWLREFGVGLAWLVLIASSPLVYRLILKLQKNDSSEVAWLTPLISSYVEELQRATSFSNKLGVKTENPGWDFLQTTLATHSPKDAEEAACLILQERTAYFRACADDFRSMSDGVYQAKLLIREAALKAAKIKNRSLRSLVDEADEILASSTLRRAIAERDLKNFLRILRDSRNKLELFEKATASPDEDQARDWNKTDHSNDHAQASERTSLHSVGDAIQFLELRPNASQEIIRDRIKRLSSFYHPDKNSSLTDAVRSVCEEKMKLVNRAREILTDAGCI